MTSLMAPAPAAAKNLIIWSDADKAPAIKKAIAPWASSNGVTVTVVVKDFGKVRDELITAGPKGLGPDIIAGPHDWLGSVVASGALARMTNVNKGAFAGPVIDAMSYKDDAGKYMTGSFMTIKNSGGADVTLVGGSSESAERIEIHEVVNGTMQPLSDGLVIKAGKSVMLRMGGYHVMLLGLNKEIKAGDEVTVTLEFSDGQSIEYTAPVKDIAMDDEKYGAMGMTDGAMK